VCKGGVPPDGLGRPDAVSEEGGTSGINMSTAFPRALTKQKVPPFMNVKKLHASTVPQN